VDKDSKKWLEKQRKSAKSLNLNTNPFAGRSLEDL
jgi:hypothetical protein